ncbi:hypothetical protein RYX36_018351 [Vicia faba]
MLCCGGAEEDFNGLAANHYSAAAIGANAYGGGGGGAGGDRGEPRSNIVKSGGPQKALEIEIPEFKLNELKRDGVEAAIKKLDTSSSPEVDSDFESQLAIVSRLKNEHFVALMGYCLEANNRILVYEYASLDFNLTNQSSDTAARLHSTRVLGTFGYHAPEYAMTGQITQKSDVYSFGVVLLELLTGRKPVDHTMPKGQQSLVTWATPRLSEDKVKQCVDPKLNNEYPPKAIAKLAAVAALCVQYEADFRPNMTIVVKALQPLLNSKPAGPSSNA